MKKNNNLPKKISIFPLSNFIFFPQTSVPLNIFEPRYIKMINDCMKSNRIIGMIQPKKKAVNIPELYSVGCAGKIVNFNETKDGRYLIILSGISRFKILKEINNSKPYREYEVSFDEFIDDTVKKKNEIPTSDLKLILKNLETFYKKRGCMIDWNQLKKQNFNQTINSLAMVSPFSLEEKQVLLETSTILNRKIELEKILNTYAVDDFSNTTLQ